MNKKLILTVVLALGFILVGTGYAYWTDTLNVTTKATTGDLDVTFVDLGAYAKYGNETNEGEWSIIDGIGDNGYVDSDFFGMDEVPGGYNKVFGDGGAGKYYEYADDYNKVEMDAEITDPGTGLTENYPNLPYGVGHNYGDKIEITLGNIYPGYAQAFRTDIINIGSIAAKLSAVNFKLDKDGSRYTRDMIGVALLVQDENYPAGTIAFGEMVLLAKNFAAKDKFELGGVEFVRLSALKDKVLVKGEDGKGIINDLLLVPNASSEHRADLFIGVAVDPDAAGKYTTGSVAAMTDKDDTKSQNKTVTLDIEFGWDQFNVGNDPDTTNILKYQNKN